MWIGQDKMEIVLQVLFQMFSVAFFHLGSFLFFLWSGTYLMDNGFIDLINVWKVFPFLFYLCKPEVFSLYLNYIVNCQSNKVLLNKIIINNCNNSISVADTGNTRSVIVSDQIPPNVQVSRMEFNLSAFSFAFLNTLNLLVPVSRFYTVPHVSQDISAWIPLILF